MSGFITGRLIGATVALTLAMACAPRGGVVRAPMGAGACYPLAELEAAMPSLAAAQHFKIEKRNREFQFQGFVELEPNRLAMVGLTPLGSHGFSLVWEHGELAFERLPFYRLPLRSRELLAAYQWMYWSKPLLERALDGSGISFEEQFDRGRLRRFYYKQREICRISYAEADPWAGRVELHNLRRGYRLSVETRDVHPLEPLQ